MTLQTIGRSTGRDATVIHGDPATGSFSVAYLKDGCVLALDSVSAVKDYVQGRRLVETYASPSAEDLGDPSISPKDVF